MIKRNTFLYNLSRDIFRVFQGMRKKPPVRDPELPPPVYRPGKAGWLIGGEGRRAGMPRRTFTLADDVPTMAVTGRGDEQGGVCAGLRHRRDGTGRLRTTARPCGSTPIMPTPKAILNSRGRPGGIRGLSRKNHSGQALTFPDYAINPSKAQSNTFFARFSCS
jgi:hypothetical protein